MAASSAPQTSEIARRYACALFELASDRDDLAEIHRAFADLVRLAGSSPDLMQLLVSPVYAREDKVAGLTRIARQAGLPELLTGFLGTMAQNGRASEIVAAERAFDALYARARGVRRAVVTTAVPMRDDQRDRLEGIIARSVGSDVEISEEVDKDLIGGIQLQIGSTLVDASLKAKLDRMNTAMKGA